ncbi:MAG: urate hydroxylase PuuD, partial [Xanthomonadales bacterium]|nr:urate hydroxylase PuuD [Xanthomonadales bacterium]
MESHLHAWLSLLLRWTHVIAGVAWIGTSFYFSWLENRLRRLGQHHDISDNLKDVQGGGFNYLRSLAIAPEALPSQLDWFKRAAYTTWISGALILIVIYYAQAGTFMVDTGVADIPARLAVTSGLSTLVLSWLFYDLLCRSPLARNELLLGAFIFGWFGVVTWVLTQMLNGHAAYVNVGAAVGTIMVANVFHMISPAQKDLV